MVKVFRPYLDDVENLSYGKGAKRQRGTGCRDHCHRLNREERFVYERSKRDGYMVLRRNGPRNGYRKARKGSPLVNTFRQRCDALELICIIIESTTRIVIDFSTLRVKDDAQFLSLINENVLFQKYPKYYTTSTTRSKNEKNGDNDDDDNEPKKITWSNHRRRNDNDGSITAPIDWIAVQTRPIWDVPKRILTIDCCDDDAKSVALDILKLQDTDFRYIDIDTINNNSDDNEEVEEDNNDSGEDDKLSSIIDFDDI